MKGPADRRRLLAGGGAALALAGLWVGHTVEYVRVLGTAGLRTELFGSIHAYMLPLGAAIALVTALLGIRLWRVWAALSRRLDAAHAAVRALVLGHRPAEVREPVENGRAPSLWAGILIAWPALTLLQIALYLFQENVEAIGGGETAPGLGAVTGVHALAPLVHAVVALVLVTATAGAMRLLRRRANAVEAVEEIVRALLRALTGRAVSIARPAVRDERAPLQLLGLRPRQRPPPALLSA